jgi:phosphatidylinositol alpha-1,6-mannosyltransferase
MILFATQNFLPSIGGTQLYVTGLADALAARGHAIEVYCDAASRGASAKVDRARNYPIRRFGGFRPLLRRRKARAVAQRVAAGDVTAVITDTWKSLEYISARTLANVRVLCLAHGSEFLVPPGSGKERRMIASLAKADIVAANSQFTAELVKPFVRGKTEVRVIWPGVEPPLGALRNLTPRNTSAGPRLLTIARLERRKGIDRVLRALPSLAEEFPQISYDAIGKGEDHGRLLRLANDMKLGSRVRFHGYISEEQKADLLARADIFLLPNRRERGSVEGFGIVFLEAAAFGTPSIAGADGGTADAVLDGQTGLIVQGDDESAVRAAISRLAKDHHMCRAMGEAAHRRFWNVFAWDAAIERFEDALQLQRR